MPALIGNLQGIGEAVGGVGKTVIDIGKGIKTLITGKVDPETQNAIDLGWANLEAAAMAQQNKINEIEAGRSGFWIAGGRPAVIWICALILFNNYILAPYLLAAGVRVPQLDLNALWPVMTSLLGLGGMRTYEKTKGVQGRH